jgi:beta-lactamase regulating signal transducer with metallopeptidase domain
MSAGFSPQFAPRIAVHLLDPAMRSLVLAVLAGLILKLWRVRDERVELAVWTGVLYAALAMPLLSWVMPAIRLPLPALFKQSILSGLSASTIQIPVPKPFPLRPDLHLPPLRHPAHQTPGTNREAITANIASQVPATSAILTSGNSRVLSPMQQLKEFSLLFTGHSLLLIYLAIYAVGLAALLGQIAVGMILSRRLRQQSTLIESPHVLRQLRQSARALGLIDTPVLAESHATRVPLTIGFVRPMIVIPTDWREWSEVKLAAVLTHELSHVRRGDSRTRMLILLYRSIFWFSPLGWWLERRIAELAEQASDADAIHAGAEPISYAEVLMSFFEISRREGRVNWPGVSMVRGLGARKRIEKILSSGAALPAAVKTPVLALLALGALPMVWLTAATNPVLTSTHTPLPLPAQSVASVRQAKPVAAALAPISAARPVKASSGLGPQTLAALSPRVLALPALLGSRAASVKSASALSQGQAAGAASTDSSDDGWLLSYTNPARGDYTMMNHFSMPGDELVSLRKKLGDNFILVKHEGKTFVIRDATTVNNAYTAVLDPVAKAAGQAASIQKMQNDLAKQQDALGKLQESVRISVPINLDAQLKKVEEEIRALGPTASQDDLGRIQTDLGSLQSSLGELQSKAGEQQGELGRQ